MIHIITTGGTIEGIDKDSKENELKSCQVLLEDFLSSANVSFSFTIENAFKKDSRSISPEDRKILADKIKFSEANKILITHGTFTMEDTAKYLGRHKLKKIIVLTGSFVLGSSANTDAPFNLGYAISSLRFLKPDVYVAMNGEIFHWNNVTKNLETNKFERKND
ncbi:asparaginase domain-containing protein [Pricia sp.]|uniref:asparaginase domain-containing protein n=1 Tax=Pricia sp. TaxID=2268138 RepID=UPI0035937633